MTRKVALAAAALVVVLPLLASVGWACTPLPRSFLVAPDVAKARTTTKVTAQGLTPGTPVEVLWNGLEGKVIGSVTADDRGQFTLPVTVPDSAPGSYAIVFMARSSGGPAVVGRLPFSLTSPAPAVLGAGDDRVGGAGARTAIWGRDSGSGASAPSGANRELALGVGLSSLGLAALAGGTASLVVRRRRSLSAS